MKTDININVSVEVWKEIIFTTIFLIFILVKYDLLVL